MAIGSVPRSVKRTTFSVMSKSRKHRYKDELLEVLHRTYKDIAAETVVTNISEE